MKDARLILLGLGTMLCAITFAARGEVSVGMSVSPGSSVVSGEFAVEFAPVVGRELSPARVSDESLVLAVRLELRAIIGAAEASLGERIKAVHGLGRELARDEIALLFMFLKTPPARKEQELSDLPALKNDILNVLRMQSSPPPGFTDTLISIWSNPAQDVVLRDYALQHLFVWYEQGALDAADARTKIEDTLFEAACQFNSLAGTAILGLHRLSAADPAFSHGEINRLALRLVQSPATDLATRITAIQICAERGLKEALPAIEAAAQASDCVPLRLSASAATTRLSGEERDWRLGPLTGRQVIGAPATLAATLGPAPRDGPYE